MTKTHNTHTHNRVQYGDENTNKQRYGKMTGQKHTHGHIYGICRLDENTQTQTKGDNMVTKTLSVSCLPADDELLQLSHGGPAN